MMIQLDMNNFYWEKSMSRLLDEQLFGSLSFLAAIRLSLVLRNVRCLLRIVENFVDQILTGILVRNDQARNELRKQVGKLGIIL